MKLFEALKKNSFCWRVMGGVSLLFCRFSVHGQRNQIKASSCFMSRVKFNIRGSDNVIDVGNRAVLRGVVFRIRGSGHRVRIGERCRFTRGSEIWIEDDKTQLIFGNGTTVERGHFAVTESGSKMGFGNSCMLATDVEVRTGDSHSILDAKTGARINRAADVVVGDHVWIGSRVSILKGVTIEDNSIVASGSVVTKSIGSGCITGGNPARELKSGVTWSRERL